MRKLSYVLIMLFFMLSCGQEDSVRTEEIDFKKDLIALSNENFGLFYVTRSGPVGINMEILERAIEKTAVLSKKYDIEKQILESGYYTKFDMNLSGSEIDANVMYNWINENSTDEFQKILYDMIMKEQAVDLDVIIDNVSLLPNEQIALVILNNMVGNDILNFQSRSLSDCRNQYDSTMGECKKWLYIGCGLTVVSAVASFGTLSTAFAVATTIDYERCSGSAMSTYMECVEENSK